MFYFLTLLRHFFRSVWHLKKQETFERVYKRLEKQNIACAYEEVFEQQEALGFIESVKQKVSDKIWTPHRPFIRNETDVTTKTRPAFNCRLKMGKVTSLNEAAFPRIDLMNNK